MANGFELVTNGMPVVGQPVIAADGSRVTAALANNNDSSHPSFFLQNCSFVVREKLPRGVVSFDISVENTGSTSLNFFGDNLPTLVLAVGQSFSQNQSFHYTGGYFGYFGININDGNGTAKVLVTLSNLVAPVPAPAAMALFGLGALGLAALRRTRQG